jgi:hypothetical protein
MEKMHVTFRVYRGELCAYLLDDPATYEPGFVGCYVHVGQHGSASTVWLQKGRPATPAEYADLLAELRGIYETNDAEHIALVVVKRDRQEFRKRREAERLRSIRAVRENPAGAPWTPAARAALASREVA